MSTDHPQPRIAPDRPPPSAGPTPDDLRAATVRLPGRIVAIVPVPEPTAQPIPPANGPPAATSTPETIGKYRVLGRLGNGAMGVVYKCSQPGLDRPVAVKVLLAARHATPAQVRRFEHEARSASRLAHPGIVQIFDVGCDDGLPYFVMEFVDGWSVDRLIGSPALTVHTTLRVVYHVARALQAAHDQGVIHRDVKPSNILLDQGWQVKLADFGLAKTETDGPPLTASSDLVGTPRYMSPDQILLGPGELDHRTDVYSLGAVMYEMLTGRPPADGPTVLHTLRAVTDDVPPPIERYAPDVPPAVRAICTRAMAKDRDQRFPTAGALADAVQGYLLDTVLGTSAVLVLPTPGGGPGPPGAPRIPLRPWAPNPKRRHPTAVPVVVLALILLTGLFSAVVGLRGRERPAPTAVDLVDLPALRDKVLAEAAQSLGGPLVTPDLTPSRSRLREKLDRLALLLKYAPGDHEIRLLRARAARWAGEFLASLEDCDEILAAGARPAPGTDRPSAGVEAAAVWERVLARYQLNVLYLGNLNEHLLQPRSLRWLAPDLRLLARGSPTRQALAELVRALAQQDYSEAGRIAVASAGLPDDTGLGPDDHADRAMLEADALFHAAARAFEDETESPDPAKPFKRRQRDDLVRRAGQVLRRGLDLAPNHVGLLFLKANSFHRRVRWEAPDAEKVEALQKRYKPAFESTCDCLRTATVRLGCDTAIARAVLLNNLERNEEALDQIKDAVSGPGAPASAVILKCWLTIQAPPGGVLAAEELQLLLAELRPLFASPPDEFHPYFIRALVFAALGRPEAARSDLRACRRHLGRDELPTASPVFNEWLKRANGSTTEYLDATAVLLAELPVPADVRIRVGETLLARLADPALTEHDGLTPDQTRSITAWTHFRQAAAFAGKEDRGRALDHVRACLSMRVDGLTPETVRSNNYLSTWNDDAVFKALYAEFQPPPPAEPKEPPDRTQAAEKPPGEKPDGPPRE